MFNKNELILNRVRSVVAHYLDTGKMMFRMTSVEEPSLQCTAEGEEIVDAIGSLITTLYRAKKATFTGSNSLVSLDLMAAQYGTQKEIATAENKIVDYTYEIHTVEDGKITLKHAPIGEIKYIYSMVAGEVGTCFVAGSAVSDTEFVYQAPVAGTDGAEDTPATIQVPTGLTGKVYVEYQYENTEAIKITNKAANFPEACSLVIYAYFNDKCNENLTYSGKIIAPKAKLNPSQIELALTSTGKHPFEFTMMKDYCEDDEDAELFSVIVSQ